MAGHGSHGPAQRAVRAACRAAVLAFTAICTAACAGGDSPPLPDLPRTANVAAADSTPAPFLSDSVVHGYGETDTVQLDSLRVEMARLEDALAQAPAGDHPQLLLELGRTNRHYIAPYGGPHADYARSRPDEYIYDEIGGRFVYRGRHLLDFATRFSGHPLADDAAWQLTMLTPAGECEGFVVCYIQYHWRMVRDFLAAHPDSPYAPLALDRAIAGFEHNLRNVTDLTRSSEYYDAGDLPPLLADFDSVTAGLPPPLRERAVRLGSQVRARLARK